MKKLFSLLTAAIYLIALCACSPKADTAGEPDNSTIKIGVLFSDTGDTAVVERAMKNAAFLAFDEINANGGINGTPIEYVYSDYYSDPSIVQVKMEELIKDENVVATIGCNSSASRRAVLPLLEKYNSLLVYPTYTEGREQHPNVIYTGAMPNQQAGPYLEQLMENCGKKVFLLGNDYVFSVESNKYAKRKISENGGEICGEEYAPMGYFDYTDILNTIKEEQPDFVYCDLVGDSLIMFFQAYKNAGLNSEICPVAAITMDEMQLQSIDDDAAEGNYTSMSYFSTIDSSENREFTEKYNEYVNDNSTITCLAEATYYSCYLLAEALSRAEDINSTESIIEAFSGLEFDAPQGKIHIDETNHCTWLFSRIAQIHNGAPEIIYQSDEAIKPDPWED